MGRDEAPTWQGDMVAGRLGRHSSPGATMTGSNGSTAVSDQPALPRPEGLEGVVAASTALSHVLGEEGKLVYRGYDIHELAGKASFEEVAFLLWKGDLPSRDELTQLLRTLGEQRPLPEHVIDVIRD